MTIFKPSSQVPLVIAHRGASGYRPEHTLAAYRLAIAMGADAIEIDLVATADGALVARHENELSATTDVSAHPAFADRRVTRLIDGASLTGWFSEDFTLAELKTLRCREPMPDERPHNTLYNGRYAIPTLDEIIALVQSSQHRLQRQIGIVVETKHPGYFESIGLALEPPLLATLARSGYTTADAPLVLQSFEVAHLQRLRELTRLPIVQLIDEAGQPPDFRACGDERSYADLLTPAGLAAIAAYAQGIGPCKNLVIPRDADGRLLGPTPLVADAHQAGLLVAVWTFRNENAFLPADFRAGDRVAPTAARYGDAFAEYARFCDLGLDGLISDNPDTALEACGLH